MAERIPQSVAYLVVFRAFLASDGKTPATGKTIALTISKNGGAFGNPNVGALNATEISSGFYKFTLDTTDTGTAGPLAWRGAEGTINDAGDVLSVVNAHNAGFDGTPNAAAGVNNGLPVLSVAGTTLGYTVSTVATLTGYVAPLDAPGTRAALGLASANLDTQLGAIDDFIDTEVSAIKAKTDNLPAAPASQADCITAAGVRTAVGMASANLDTQLATLDTDIMARASATVAPSWYTAPPSAVVIADTTLRRQMVNVEASASGDALNKSSLYGSIQAQQKSSVSGVVLTVQRTDGTTLGTFTLTVSAGASPIIGVA